MTTCCNKCHNRAGYGARAGSGEVPWKAEVGKRRKGVCESAGGCSRWREHEVQAWRGANTMTTLVL